MDVTLYIGNLARSVTEHELRDLFSHVGEVTGIRLMRDRFSGESKEYGFLAMSCQSEADHAVSRFDNFVLNGRFLTVSLVAPRSRTGA